VICSAPVYAAAALRPWPGGLGRGARGSSVEPASGGSSRCSRARCGWTRWLHRRSCDAVARGRRPCLATPPASRRPYRRCCLKWRALRHSTLRGCVRGWRQSSFARHPWFSATAVVAVFSSGYSWRARQPFAIVGAQRQPQDVFEGPVRPVSQIILAATLGLPRYCQFAAR